MTMGIFTLSKIKPLSENIRGLEQSMQARYHAKSGEEIAKLIYYSDLKKAKAVLDDPDFENKTDTQKAKAFCRTDGDVLLNDREKRRAIADCIGSKLVPHQHGTDAPHTHDREEAESLCKTQYTTFLPAGYTPPNSSITYECSEQSVADAQPIKDAE